MRAGAAPDLPFKSQTQRASRCLPHQVPSGPSLHTSPPCFRPPPARLQPSLSSRLHLPTPKTQPKSSALCLPSSPGVREATSEIQGSEGRNAAGSEVREAEGRNFTSPHPFAPHEQQQSRWQRGGSQGQTPLTGRGLGGAGQSPATSYSTRFWPGGFRHHLQCFSLPCWSVKVGLRAKLPKQSSSRKSRRDLKLCSAHVELRSQHLEPALGASRAYMP